jgi:hypothetical protein
MLLRVRVGTSQGEDRVTEVTLEREQAMITRYQHQISTDKEAKRVPTDQT